MSAYGGQVRVSFVLVADGTVMFWPVRKSLSEYQRLGSVLEGFF